MNARGSSPNVKQTIQKNKRRERGLAAARKIHPNLIVPREYKSKDLTELLHNLGVKQVVTLDFFDKRADLRYDMNRAVPKSQHGRYGTLIDIGCLEHVFDARQCIENCMKMVKVGGSYVLHTAIKGFYRHGLHTFDPLGLVDAFRENGFKITFYGFSLKNGRSVESPSEGENVAIWLVGRKLKQMRRFVIPQQRGWTDLY